MHGRRLETPPFFLELKSGTMKKEKQPEWLIEHIEKEKVEIPTHPHKTYFVVGNKMACVSKVVVDFKGQDYWTYASFLSDEPNGSYLLISSQTLDRIVSEHDPKALTESIIEDYYSKV